MRHLPADLRQALRVLARAPGFSAVIVLILAVGIGAGTVIFGVADAILLRPLSYPDSRGLVSICETNPSVAGFCVVSPRNATDWAEASKTLEGIGLARGWPFLLRAGGQSSGVAAGLATPAYFRVLRATPAVGRLFRPEEQDVGNNRVVLISYQLWQERFGGDPGIVNRTITLDGDAYTVVGVLSADFRAPQLGDVRLWTPWHINPHQEDRRSWRGFRALARLAPGATLAQARAELTALDARTAQAHPETNEGWGVTVQSLRDAIVGNTRPIILVFAGAVALLLLIGCANVANLLLVRATDRRREFAMRAVLGAERRDLFRQLLTESVVFSLIAAVVAFLLALWGTAAFVRLAPGGVPRLQEVGLNGQAFLFAVVLSLVVTAVFGLAPASRAMRVDLARTLNEGGASGRTTAGGRMRRVLVVAEMALTLTLLIGAALLIRSFAGLVAWQPGFDRQHLVAMSAYTSTGKYTSWEQMADFLTRAREELSALPGVRSVGTASSGPLFGGRETGRFRIIGRPSPDPADLPSVRWYDVGPNYFQTLGLPLVRGRFFDARDRAGAPQVALINEAMAQRYWPGQDPLGQRVQIVDPDTLTVEVVGVVADAVPFHRGQPTEPEVYWPNQQHARWGNFFLIRTAGNDASVIRAVQDRLSAIDPDIQLGAPHTLDQLVDTQLVAPRFNMVLVGLFAAAAIILAAAGLYGVLAYAVAMRRREIGIRMALGAERQRVVRGVLGEGLALVGVGAVLGIVGALSLSRFLASMLFGVAATDPDTYGAALLLLLVVATLASWLPARRASRVDPMIALRAE